MNSDAGTVRLYQELLTLVKNVYETRNVDKLRIEDIIRRVIEVFDERPFNELLLYAYTISKGNYIFAHIANDVIFSVGFAKSLNLSGEDVLDVGLIAFCHDFGMMEYTELFQKVLQLTEEEKIRIRQHPSKSVEMFRPYFPERVLQGIMDVHECVDTTGYPQAKGDQDISAFAKIVAICDTFEALSHPRQFRKELSPYEAMKMIIKKKDSVFDRRVVKKFVEFLSIYPVGQLVYLNTGETGIVTGSNVGFPTRSIVRVLLNAKREIEQTEKTIDLLNDPMVYISGPVKDIEEKEILQVIKPRGDHELLSSIL